MGKPNGCRKSDDVSTTMIYLHLIDKKGAGAPSPLDLPPPTQQP